jgi:hypothetical protein
MKSKNKGYILGTVLCLATLILIIVTSLFQLITTQRKLSLKKELVLQAYNAAETSIDYAYSPIINDIGTNTIDGASTVPKTGYKEFTFSTNVTSYLASAPTMAPTYSGKISNIVYSNRTVRVLPPGADTRYYVSGSDPANVGSPVINQWVNEKLVPIVASVTATQSGNSYTAYVQKSIASQQVSLFQYSIFFQGQLHMHRGFRPMGDVHTNGMLFLNAHDDDYATYNGAVSATGHIYRGSTFDGGGTGSDGYGYVPITVDGDADFSTARNPQVVPKQTGGSSPHLQILVGGTTSYVEFPVNKDYKNDPSNWKKWASDTFAGNLQDKSHDVPAIKLVGAAGYNQDVAATTDINEFNNGPYKLIEPTFPTTSAFDGIRMSSNSNNLEANACLILMVEYNNGPYPVVADTDPIAIAAQITLHTRDNGQPVVISNGKVFTAATSGTMIDPVGNYPTLSYYSDPWRMFIVKGYRVKADWDPTDKVHSDIHDYLGAITLPDKVIGAANGTVTAVTTNLKMEDYDVALSGPLTVSSTINKVGSTNPSPIAALTSGNKSTIDTDSSLSVNIRTGLFDSRLGRGVTPLTIDLDAMKDIMETPIANLTNPSHNLTFRNDFDPTAATGTYKKWNGLVYIEFPTSLTLAGAITTNTSNDIQSIRFSYSSTPEYRHPDRSVDTLAADGRASRTDKIIPIAPELRRYPASSASKNSTILDAQYAIPAVQLINGRSLPHPNAPALPADNTEGFTIATNVPVYVVGNYNSDGDYTTGSNIASDTPGTYAQAETDPVEIPAAIFCDMFTVLSNGWGVQNGTSHRSNRQNSFYAKNNGSTANNETSTGTIASPPGRSAKSLAARTITHFKVPTSFTYPASNPSSGAAAKPYVEISACIATGEYPIFEFFTHALESYQPMYSAMGTTKANPIIFKGSLVGMFHSEIQHIKQAYGRSVASNVQTSGDSSGDIWQQHGAYAIAGSRFHQFLVDGNFPPGTPKAYLTTQKKFSLLHWSTPADAAVLTAAGFTAP